MQLNSLFQDGAVLQREIFIPVWGTTAPNCKIEAELNGSKSLSRSSNTGYFILRLPPQQAGGPYTLTVRNVDNGETVTVNDVMIGEVSSVNDDHTDNTFLEQVGRFPEIEEDVPAEALLCTEYPELK